MIDFIKEIIVGYECKFYDSNCSNVPKYDGAADPIPCCDRGRLEDGTHAQCYLDMKKQNLGPLSKLAGKFVNGITKLGGIDLTKE